MDIFGRKRINEYRSDIVNLSSMLCNSQAKCIELEQQLKVARDSRDYWGNAYWKLRVENTDLKRSIKSALGEDD